MLSHFLLGRISFCFWNVILFRVILTNIRLLSGLLLNAILHNIFLQSFIMTKVTLLSVILLLIMGLNDIILPILFWRHSIVILASVVLLNVIILSIFLTSIILTSVTQLSVILLFIMGQNDILLSVILPLLFWQYHSIVILSFSWVLPIKWHSLQHLYTMYHSPQCHSAVCRSTECRGAAITERSQSSEWVCVANKNKMKGCKTSQTRGQFENKKKNV